MTRSELLKRVAGRTPDISKKDMELVIDPIFESMAQALRSP